MRYVGHWIRSALTRKKPPRSGEVHTEGGAAGKAKEFCRRQNRSARAKLTVAGIAEARHDVANLVEPFVYGRHVDGHVRMSAGQTSDAFRRRNEPDKLDALGAPALQHVDRRCG